MVLSPGSFTQSFFGVSGSLDLRGTSGETYFNGVRRLDNPGNYTTPIAAADRVDIVRGPASVIYGPSKIGGYMNFIPKSARADTGQFLSRPTGGLSFTGGSWSKAMFTAEVGGPGRLGGRTSATTCSAKWRIPQLLQQHRHGQRDCAVGVQYGPNGPRPHRLRRHVPRLQEQPGGGLEPFDPSVSR